MKSSAVTRNIDIVPAPPLYQYHAKGGTVVLIDVLRFTSTLTTALANGALWAETFADPEKALAKRDEGYIVAGEKNGIVLDGFLYNNSPVSMTRENIGGRKLAFVTTNGTYMRSLIEEYDAIYAGCFLNVSALTDRLLQGDNDIQLVCSGTQNRLSTDDFVFAGMVADRLLKTGQFVYNNDSVALARTLYQCAKDDIKTFILNHSPRTRPFCKTHEHYRNDLEFAMQVDMYDAVPEEESPFKFVLKP